MASIAYPSLAKKATLSDGTTYGYAAVAASPSKPTFLLLHGYPSSSFDWRHQVAALQKSGYGVIAPDLLGYGDTDKPAEVEAYNMKRMSGHMVEILDLEKVSRCIAVGHDWGVGLLSRLPTYHADRFYGIVPISVSYLEPGLVWDIDLFCNLTQEMLGYATYGYWKWHNTEEAVADCDNNPDSVFSILYPADPNLWKTDFGPIGKAKEWVTKGTTTALPSWYSKEDFETRKKILAKGGYRGPLSWYKSAMRGVNLADEAQVPEEQKPCPLPTLLIVSEDDFVTRADMQSANSQKWAPKLRIETLDCGHWVPLERPEAVVKLLEGFAAEVVNNSTIAPAKVDTGATHTAHPITA